MGGSKSREKRTNRVKRPRVEPQQRGARAGMAEVAWRVSIGMRTWGKGREAPELQRLRVGLENRGEESHRY